MTEDGIIGKAEDSKSEQQKAVAREKLEIKLAGLQTEKLVNKRDYTEGAKDYEYFETQLGNEYLVSRDIVTILEEGWQFLIDRSVPKVVDYLGKGVRNEQIIIDCTEEAEKPFTYSTITIKITSTEALKSVMVDGKNITEYKDYTKISDTEYTIKVTENKKYNIYVQDVNEKYNIGDIKAEKVTDNMEIWTKADLVAFRDKVNEGRTFEGKTVKVMADIDLNPGTVINENGTLTFPQNVEQWVPISSDSTNKILIFKGIFEGNNKTIKNLYINNNNYRVAGLFGNLENATVRNTSVSGSINTTIDNLNGITGIAGIVGDAVNSTIENCKNYITISGNSQFVGGIVGNLNASEIKNCANFAKLQGSLATGGLCSYLNNSSSITMSYNLGEIRTSGSGSSTGNYMVGGIVGCFNCFAGYSGTISDCYNIGNLYGGMSGGIAGFHQGDGEHYIKNSYNVGSLSGSPIYGVSGINYPKYGGASQIKLNNNYWLSGCGASVGSWYSSNVGAEPISYSDLTTDLSKLGNNFTSDIQNSDGTWKYNNGYPILKWQAK